MLCVVEGQLAYAPTVFFPMKNRCSHGGYRGMHACEIVQILQTIFQNYSLSCSVLIIMLEEKSRRFRRIHAMRWWCWCHTDDLNDAMRSIVIIIDLAAVYYACNATLKHFKLANNSHTHTCRQTSLIAIKIKTRVHCDPRQSGVIKKQKYSIKLEKHTLNKYYNK